MTESSDKKNSGHKKLQALLSVANGRDERRAKISKLPQHASMKKGKKKNRGRLSCDFWGGGGVTLKELTWCDGGNKKKREGMPIVALADVRTRPEAAGNRSKRRGQKNGRLRFTLYGNSKKRTRGRRARRKNH